LRAA
jgi:hypothetical protein